MGRKPVFEKRISLLIARHGAWLALLLLLVVCSASSQAFRSPQNLLNISRQISYSGIIAIGMTFVIIGGGIDLSVGALLALSGTLGIMAMNQCQNELLGVMLCLMLSLLAGAAGGMINGTLVTLGRLPPFIATLGSMAIFRSLTLYLANAGLTSSQNQYFGKIGGAEFLSLPLAAWLLLILTFAAWVLLNRSAFGRHLCATGANQRVAVYAAIRIDLLRFATYVLCGSLAGLSAFLLGGRLNSLSSTTAGNSYEMDGIAAAIIGGTAMSGGRGCVWGTLAGAFILGIVSNILDMWGISANFQGTVKGAVIIIAVLLQRQEAKSL
jgi:ribose transport system permease protein